jgi:hypothetical protein
LGAAAEPGIGRQQPLKIGGRCWLAGWEYWEHFGSAGCGSGLVVCSALLLRRRSAVDNRPSTSRIPRRRRVYFWGFGAAGAPPLGKQRQRVVAAAAKANASQQQQAKAAGGCRLLRLGWQPQKAAGKPISSRQGSQWTAGGFVAHFRAKSSTTVATGTNNKEMDEV